MFYIDESSFQLVCTESKYLSYPVVDIIVDERTKYQPHYKLTQFHIVAVLGVEHGPDSVRGVQLGRLDEVGDDGAHELAVAVRVECDCGANPDALLHGQRGVVQPRCTHQLAEVRILHLAHKQPLGLVESATRQT